MDSKYINATEGRVKILMDNIINSKIDDRNFEKVINDTVEDSKIKTGVITKYYPYLDKAEVKLDGSNKKVICGILHRYGGDIVDFYTPSKYEDTFCDILKEPAIIPKAKNTVCVLPINVDGKGDYLVLGYFYPEDIVGFDPAKPGNLKLTSITEPNLYWIEFGKDGLDLRLPSRPTEQVGYVNTQMKSVEYYTKSEVDNLLDNIKKNSSNISNTTNNIDYNDLLSSVENYKKTSDRMYYLFRGDCWIINNNFESSASITSADDDNLKVTGTFRTYNDKIDLYWYSKDYITHPYISYGEKYDYSNVVLEFDYRMNNCKNFKDASNNKPVNITITTNHGEIYYVSMNRFITEKGNGVYHFRLDFEDLTALPNSSYINSRGQSIIWKEGDNLKIPVNDIKYILFPIVPQEYVKEENNQYIIMDNVDFDCEIFNIEVTNGDICNEKVDLEPHKYRLCEEYDDVYDLNPRRIVREMRKLGYVNWSDLCIGASHYYEKKGDTTEGNNKIPVNSMNHSRTSKMTLVKEVPLNRAFSSWLNCYARELKTNDCGNLIISVSMKNLQCPDSWKQVDSRGNKALTDDSPSAFLYSPCNNEVIMYMKSVCQSCLDIVVANNMKPILQVEEAWWWNENDKPVDEYGNPITSHWQPPCFYDEATKQSYRLEFNKELPKYTTSWGEYDKSITYWLNKQLVNYSDKLREVVKSDRYVNGIYMALFSPPNVLDEDYVPSLMKEVNYVKEVYNPVKLDVLQLKDYNWVTGISEETKERDRSHHQKVYSIVGDLGFSVENSHYYGGFVQYSKDAIEFWKEIIKSMDDALDKGFAEVYVCSGTQIRRDNKILGYDNYELIQHILYN